MVSFRQNENENKTMRSGRGRRGRKARGRGSRAPVIQGFALIRFKPQWIFLTYSARLGASPRRPENGSPFGKAVPWSTRKGSARNEALGSVARRTRIGGANPPWPLFPAARPALPSGHLAGPEARQGRFPFGEGGASIPLSATDRKSRNPGPWKMDPGSVVFPRSGPG